MSLIKHRSRDALKADSQSEAINSTSLVLPQHGIETLDSIEQHLDTNYVRLIHAKWNRDANKHENPFKMTMNYSLPPSTPTHEFPHHFSRRNKIKIWKFQVNCKNLSPAFRESKYFIAIIDARRVRTFSYRPRCDFYREPLSSAYVITSFESKLISSLREIPAEILSHIRGMKVCS